MTPADAADAARLHAAHLTYSFFAGLGERFLRRLYRRLAKSPRGIGFVVETDAGVRAFITATTDAAGLRRELILKDAWAAGFWAAFALLRKPRLIGRALETFAYGARTDLPGVRAEMLFISIDPALRRRGLAVKLIDLVLDEFRRRGVEQTKVVTDAANAPVNALLNKFGFERRGEFPLHGKTMVLHSRSLNDLPRGQRRDPNASP